MQSNYQYKSVKVTKKGSGCVAQLVERSLPILEVPGFESSHWQKIIEHLFTVNCVLKRRK